MSEEIAFGQVLRELRKKRGFSQEAFAAEVGIARNYVSLLELGRFSVSFAVLFQIAKALDMPASELVRLAEDRIGG